MLTRIAVSLLLLGTVACHRANTDTAAVRQGVIEHVSKNAGLDTATMDISVSNVQFKGSEATAVVSFRPKNSPNNDSMQMSYNLENQDGKWVVRGKASPVGSAHGAGMPSNGINGSGGELPAGHPPVDSNQPKQPKNQ